MTAEEKLRLMRAADIVERVATRLRDADGSEYETRAAAEAGQPELAAAWKLMLELIEAP